MCLVLPSRVVGLDPPRAEVELVDGERVLVDMRLKPNLHLGDYVLVDRGIVVETIEEQEAQAILAMYGEIAAMLAAEDALA